MLCMQRHNIGKVAHRLAERSPVNQKPQRGKGAGTGFSHIQMWIGSEHSQRIGMQHHFRCDVGMHVETGHDWHVRPHLIAQAGQQFALAIFQTVGHHCAMQIKIDAVNLPGRRDT